MNKKFERFQNQVIDSERGYFDPMRTNTRDGLEYLVGRWTDHEVNQFKSVVIALDEDRTPGVIVPQTVTGDGCIVLGSELENQKPETIARTVAPLFARSILGFYNPKLTQDQEIEVNEKVKTWLQKPQSESAAAHV